MTRMDWKMNERIDVEKFQHNTITKHIYMDDEDGLEDE